jgi:hypothetical protein
MWRAGAWSVPFVPTPETVSASPALLQELHATQRIRRVALSSVYSITLPAWSCTRMKPWREK